MLPLSVREKTDNIGENLKYTCKFIVLHAFRYYFCSENTLACTNHFPLKLVNFVLKMAGSQMKAVLIAISVLLVNTSFGSWHTDTGSFELGLKTPHNVGFGFDPFANVTVSQTCRADVEYYFHQLNQKWKWSNKMHFHDWSFQSECYHFIYVHLEIRT